MCDLLNNDPFTFAHQKEALTKFQGQIIDEFLQNEQETSSDPRLLNLSMEFQDLNIQETMNLIQHEATEIASANGYSQPVQTKLKWWMTGTSVGMIILAFGLLSIEALAEYSLPLYIVLFGGICFLPRFLQSKILKDYQEFKNTHIEGFKQRQIRHFDNLQHFVELCLEDLRQRFLERKIPLQTIVFRLRSPDYEGITVKQQQEFQGNTYYSVHLAYPPGVQPLDVPQQMKSLVRETQAEMEEDVFHVLTDPVYDEEGMLGDFTQKTLPFEKESNANELLNNSKFQDVGHPNELLPFFVNNDTLECQCSELVPLDAVKYNVHQATNFDYYLIIARPCPICGVNNFYIVESAHLLDVPDELKPIFEHR